PRCPLAIIPLILLMNTLAGARAWRFENRHALSIRHDARHPLVASRTVARRRTSGTAAGDARRAERTAQAATGVPRHGWPLAGVPDALAGRVSRSGGRLSQGAARHRAGLWQADG